MSELSNILQSMIDNEGYDGPITSEVSELLVELAGAVGGAPTDITAEATFDSKVTNYGTKIYKRVMRLHVTLAFIQQKLYPQILMLLYLHCQISISLLIMEILQ